MVVFYAVLPITTLYFIFALFSGPVKKLVGRKVCAICAAVSLTWIFLLTLRLLGSNIDTVLIAILMGQSVVGLMFELEKYFEKKGWRKFWLVRILVISGGTLSIYWLLKGAYLPLLLLLSAGTLLSFTVVSTVAGESTEELKSSEEYQKAVSKLEEMMENCC